MSDEFGGPEFIEPVQVEPIPEYEPEPVIETPMEPAPEVVEEFSSEIIEEEVGEASDEDVVEPAIDPVLPEVPEPDPSPEVADAPVEAPPDDVLSEPAVDVQHVEPLDTPLPEVLPVAPPEAVAEPDPVNEPFVPEQWYQENAGNWSMRQEVQTNDAPPAPSLESVLSSLDDDARQAVTSGFSRDPISQNVVADYSAVGTDRNLLRFHENSDGQISNWYVDADSFAQAGRDFLEGRELPENPSAEDMMRLQQDAQPFIRNALQIPESFQGDLRYATLVKPPEPVGAYEGPMATIEKTLYNTALSGETQEDIQARADESWNTVHQGPNGWSDSVGDPAYRFNHIYVPSRSTEAPPFETHPDWKGSLEGTSQLDRWRTEYPDSFKTTGVADWLYSLKDKP